MAGKSVVAWIDEHAARSIEMPAKAGVRLPAHVMAAALDSTSHNH